MNNLAMTVMLTCAISVTVARGAAAGQAPAAAVPVQPPAGGAVAVVTTAPEQPPLVMSKVQRPPAPIPGVGAPIVLTTTQGRTLTQQPPVGGFGVVLVLGDLKAERAGEPLPASAQRVLADMKEFLPYSSYQMLDSQWTRGGHRMTSRLRGLDGQEYELYLQSGQTLNGVNVQFQLREAGTNPMTARDEEVAVQRLLEKLVAAEQQVGELRQRYSASHPEVVAAGRETELLRVQAERAQQGRAARAESTAVRSPVIDTTFHMNVGETVVVGTSRLKGDQALIVLLTAAK